jgi:lysine/ornithine N-monooxygenase
MIIKEFTLAFRVEDNNMKIEGNNAGFTAAELIGLLEWKKQDILNQIAGKIKPDVVKRTVIQEDKQ